MSQRCSQCTTKSGKPEEATTAGQEVADHQVKRSHVCVNCGRKGVCLKQCSKCQSVHDCSQKCQRPHWIRHKQLCCAIKYLTRRKGTLLIVACMFVILHQINTPKLQNWWGRDTWISVLCTMCRPKLCETPVPKFLLFLTIGLLRTCPQLRAVEWINRLMTKNLT